MKIRRSQVSFIARVVFGALFFIFGFTYSNTSYFQEYPLFGVKFLAEFLLAIAGGMFGFYLVPTYFMRIKNWVEELIVNTTYNLVTDVWNQYSKRMEQSRKVREKERKKRDKKNLKDKIKGGILLDTSVLIDGRILEIAKTGFITNDLVIPKFVINELHLLSDNADNLKRKKGRRGLDMINELKKHSKVIVFGIKATNQEVDAELVKVAKECDLSLMTLDFNLNKVANVSNVKVLNINELSEALKPAFVPGETMTVKVVQAGKEEGQGIGYLEDGTMIVVAEGDNLIDKNVDVVVSKLIQTNAGKMVFTEIKK